MAILPVQLPSDVLKYCKLGGKSWILPDTNAPEAVVRLPKVINPSKSFNWDVCIYKYLIELLIFGLTNAGVNSVIDVKLFDLINMFPVYDVGYVWDIKMFVPAG